MILWSGLQNAENGELGWRASQKGGVLAHLWSPWCRGFGGQALGG